MKKLKAVICAGMALAVISSAAAFTGCHTNETPNETLSDFQITYQKYRADAEAKGDDILSYEEWLESIKGEDGEDGSTWKVGNTAPVDSEGKNGDFYLNTSNFDIYLKTDGAWNHIGNIKGAQGAQGIPGEQGIQGKEGKSAYEVWKADNPDTDLSEEQWLESLKGSKGDPGNTGADGTKWFTGTEAPEENEGAAAAKVGDFYLNTTTYEFYQKGAEGNNWTKLGQFGAGQPGEDGTKWFTGTEAPEENEGAAAAKVGDFYLNTTNFELYQKSAENWTKLGALGGGQSSSSSVNYDPVELGQVSLNANKDTNLELNDKGIEPGWNYVYADLGSGVLDDGTFFQAKIEESVTYSTFCKSAASYAEHNIYFGLINIPDTSKKLNLKNATSDKTINAKISVKKYQPVTIESGVPFEIALFRQYTFPTNAATARFSDEIVNKIMSNVGVADIKFKAKVENIGLDCSSMQMLIDGANRSVSMSSTNLSDANHEYSIRTTSSYANYTSQYNPVTALSQVYFLQAQGTLDFVKPIIVTLTFVD